MSPMVVGIGELLVDFVATKPVSYLEAITFKKCFGGAPMNTLIGVARLGLSSGAIASIGEDPFGEFLVRILEKNEVDTSQVKVKKGRRTTLAFVANEPQSGERSFIFYRKPWVHGTSDSALSVEDIDLDYVNNASILHVSGFALSQNPARKAILSTVKYAKKSGVEISFDPTLRFDVWTNKRLVKKMYRQMLRLSDIVLFSQEEAAFMFGIKNPERTAMSAIKYGVNTVGIKLGSKGAFVKNNNGKQIHVPSFKVKAVDTTGAGDGWNAGLLVGFHNEWDLEKCVTVANAVGALVVTKHGAITALPSTKDLNTFLKTQGFSLEI